MKILLLIGTDETSEKARIIAKTYFSNIEIINGKDTIGNDVYSDNYITGTEKGCYDFILSFLWHHKIPENVLKLGKTCLNFHPGSEKYGGFGYNFALYNNEKEYGVVCHHMNNQFDNGKIVKVIHFPLSEFDSVHSLKEVTHTYLIVLFRDILLHIKNSNLPESDIKWVKYYSGKDFRKLCEITFDMSDEEVMRRIRATYYKGAKDCPYLIKSGFKFEFSFDAKAERQAMLDMFTPEEKVDKEELIKVRVSMKYPFYVNACEELKNIAWVCGLEFSIIKQYGWFNKTVVFEVFGKASRLGQFKEEVNKQLGVLN